MSTPFRFPYQVVQAGGGIARIPFIPIRLQSGNTWVDAEGLIDSGATLSVLPYDLGVRLGLDWDAEPIPVRLSGNLASQPAKAIVLLGTVNGFPPVRLAFAWSRISGFPLLLGQINFFDEFDICFYRSRSEFTVAPRTP